MIKIVGLNNAASMEIYVCFLWYFEVLCRTSLCITVSYVYIYVYGQQQF